MSETPHTLVDSNVLLDLIQEDRRWLPWSSAQLARCRERGSLAINPIIYAELTPGFDDAESLDQALPAADFQRLPLPYGAAFLAGQAFVAYRRRGGQKHSPLPDFYIGAHALLEGMTLLTRDAARYKSYFPGLKLIAP